MLRDKPIFYNIVDDGKGARCSACGKIGKLSTMIYIEQEGGKRDIIIHRDCIGIEWITKNQYGTPYKRRNAKRVWWLKDFKLKLIMGGKADEDDTGPKVA